MVADIAADTLVVGTQLAAVDSVAARAADSMAAVAADSTAAVVVADSTVAVVDTGKA
jgi:hypothetical protein